MGKFAVGQVVTSSFPFSDLSSQKKRPALVVAVAEFHDIILCQITSKPYSSLLSIQLLGGHFVDGGLPVGGYIRPDKLFTADTSIISKVYGTITSEKLSEVLTTLRSLFSS